MTDASIDLTPVRDRLRWAYGHADVIEGLVNAWVPTALAVDRVKDPKSGRTVHQARVIGEPPVDVALALSDTLHQARAALDIMVGILRGGPTGKSAFRMDTDPLTHDLDPLRDGNLQGVPAWALAIIRLHQPFSGHGWGITGEDLRKLHVLARRDRHRAALVQGRAIDLGRTHVVLSDASAETGYVARGGAWGLDIITNDPKARPQFAATVLVLEPIVQFQMWPHYPTAVDLARRMVGAAERVVMTVEAASRESGVSPAR